MRQIPDRRDCGNSRIIGTGFLADVPPRAPRDELPWTHQDCAETTGLAWQSWAWGCLKEPLFNISQESNTFRALGNAAPSPGAGDL